MKSSLLPSEARSSLSEYFVTSVADYVSRITPAANSRALVSASLRVGRLRVIIIAIAKQLWSFDQIERKEKTSSDYDSFSLRQLTLLESLCLLTRLQKHFGLV